MSNIVNYNQEYIQSILSYLSYVNMNGYQNTPNLLDINLSEEPNRREFISNYRNYLQVKLGEPKATIEYNNTKAAMDLFVNNFIITNQVVTDGFNGFSATTFQLKNDLPIYGYSAGETFIAYRGTETSLSQYGDLLTDASLVFADSAPSGPIRQFWEKVTGILSQETQSVEYLKEVLAANTSQQKIHLTGHSLGGYLAVRSLLTYQDQVYKLLEKNGEFDHNDTKAIKEQKVTDYINNLISGVSTFNGAGLSMLDGFFISEHPLANLVNNFFSVRGINITTGNFYEMITGKGQNISVFEHLGPRYGTFTENAGGMENHSMSLLLSSFGMMATLETLIKDYPVSIKDANGNILTGQDAKLYSINQLIMNATYEKSDEGKALNSLAEKIIRGFGLTEGLYYNTASTGELTSTINYGIIRWN